MSLYLPPAALAARKVALQNPDALGGLAGSLQCELHAALDVPVPEGKSRLTRNGGRCTDCTVLLAFDPRQPHAHTCPTCGAVYTDGAHHEWWLMNAHLWTAEQCTRAAALAYLLDDDLAAVRADTILAAYTDRYMSWPNRDNALGPTRPFFSTYLESIWLLHLVTALDLRVAANRGTRAEDLETCERLIRPSAALIAGFNEGRSNRQVWHCAAMLAASGVLNDSALQAQATHSLEYLLRTGLHADGSWYEGENYHLFAHRGLLSAVTLAERAGVVLPEALVARFDAGFAAPFRTMLPDGTFPSRRDSQYGIALRQYRTADWVECGLARRDIPELRAALASLYAVWPEIGETGRSNSTADAERNQQGVRLTRADCNWRALLLAQVELPPLSAAVPQSELLEGQGLAVFRRDAGNFWIGLDYGDPGDGHGHPDRLNLVIATQQSRWLDDVGTGSYTSPSLAWYRSSAAHNAPMVDGRDQGAARGTLLAHEERGDAGWVSAEFIDPVSRVRFVRTIVVMDDHVLDELVWTSERDATVDLPLQARVVGGSVDVWSAFAPETSQDSFMLRAERAAFDNALAQTLVLEALPSPAINAFSDRDRFECWIWSDGEATLWRADTIGPPAGEAFGLCALRQHGRGGRSVRVFARRGVILNVFADTGDTIVTTSGIQERACTHRRTARGWRIATQSEATPRTVTLGGFRPRSAVPVAAVLPEGPVLIHLRAPSRLTLTLGEPQYRPTEDAWRDAGSPVAQLSLVGPVDGVVRIALRAELGRAPAFASACSVNPLDNELADVNSDGVQLHWRSAGSSRWNSVIAVPDGAAVRLSLVDGVLDGLEASWTAHDGGYTVSFALPWPDASCPLAFDCIVNDRPAGRQRRRGQLVLSGANGESAYLRGARQSSARALHVVFDPAQP